MLLVFLLLTRAEGSRLEGLETGNCVGGATRGGVVILCERIEVDFDSAVQVILLRLGVLDQEPRPGKANRH